MDTKIVAAAKWSVITEVLAKLITPLTNIILAHMLAPTAFGILATIMMVISFAEMLADAGFQKFLVIKQDSRLRGDDGIFYFFRLPIRFCKGFNLPTTPPPARD